MASRHPFLTSCALAIAMVGFLYGSSLVQQGDREVAPLETIRGIQYPSSANGTITLVSESLAHADIQLREPVFAKNLTLLISFIPHTTRSLSIGIRQDPFWLSYAPISIYQQKAAGIDEKEVKTAAVTIPLTNVIQAADRSIDMMVFANTTPSEIVASQDPVIIHPVEEKTNWELISLSASVKPTLPSWNETKQYVKSIIYQERPL